HSDALLCQVARHGQGHAHQTTFGGTVGLLAHLPVKCRDGRGEHHHAALAVFHGGQLHALGGEQAADVVAADQVDVDHLGEVFQRCGVAVFAHHALGGTDAGNVHQDAGRAVCGGGLGQRSDHAFGVGDVAAAG